MGHVMISPASVQLFSGLQGSEIKVVEDAAIRRKFGRSRVIVRAHDPATSLFLVAKGCVDYFVTNDAGQDILLRRLAAGEVFGVAAFLARPIGYLGTARAVEDIQVLEWNGRVIRQLARTYPQLIENALRTALRYIALYAKRHMRLVSNTSHHRVAWALSSLGSRTGRVHPSGVEISVKNEDLASLADVGFFTASRILKGWHRKGVVEKSRGKVIVRSPEKLLAA
jgi:CRP/FNR family transcriptional regulator, nitrogen oxide reductase regulator